MSVIEDRLHYLDDLQLGQGSHAAPDNGLDAACVMEAVAYVAGEPWSDHPECASPVITSFLVAWNDSLSDEDRQMLKPYSAAARAAAWAAAWDAARAAAWDAARAAARDAARAAARAALAPTTKALQVSAFLLLDRMIEVGRS